MNEDRVFVRCGWRLIPFMALLYVVFFLDRVNVGFAGLTMNADLNFSPSVYGLGAGLLFIGFCVFSVPSSVILERVGARRWLFVTLAVWGALSAGTAFVKTPDEFYAIRFLLGVAEAGFVPGIVFYLSLWFPRNYRGQFTAGFLIAQPVAFMIGSPLSGFILGMDMAAGLRGWQWLFLIEGAPACLLAFVVLAYLPSGPEDAPWLNADEKQAIVTRLRSEDSSEHRDLAAAFADPRVWALGVVYLGYSIGYYGVQLWLPQIVQAMGFSNLTTSFLVALPFAVTMLAMWQWGRSSDRSGERVWHVALPALVAMTALLVSSVSGSNLVIFIALGVAVVSFMSLQGPYWALPQSYLGGVAAAGGIALINTLGTGAGGFVGPYLVGLLKNATGGYAVPMAVLALAPAMTAMVVLSLKKSVAAKAVLTET